MATTDAAYEEMPRSRSADLRRQYSSHHFVPADQHIKPEDIDAINRAGFIRKVYGILAAQMLLTCGVCFYCMWSEPIRMFVIHLFSFGYFGQLALFIPLMAVLCCLQAAKNEYPMNFFLLFIFTLFMAVDIGAVCAVYAQAGKGGVILEAFGLTAFLFFTLSAYTIISGKNFGFMGAYLFAGLLTCLFASFLSFFIPGIAGNIVYCVFGVLVFCGYIVYDTWKITKVFGYDDYITAAIELYLDILNLFLYLVQLLGDR